MRQLKCKVVKLPTNKPNNVTTNDKGAWFHIYFTSNEILKDDDYVVFTETGEIGKVVKGRIQLLIGDTPHLISPKWAKIEATSDNTLKLPTIPQSFIVKYAQKEIKEVMIEVEESGKVKTRSSYNTVIVSRVKDSWTLEEVKVLTHSAFSCGVEFGCDSDSYETDETVFNDWFEENI